MFSTGVTNIASNTIPILISLLSGSKSIGPQTKWKQHFMLKLWLPLICQIYVKISYFRTFLTWYQWSWNGHACMHKPNFNPFGIYSMSIIRPRWQFFLFIYLNDIEFWSLAFFFTFYRTSHNAGQPNSKYGSPVANTKKSC